MVNNLHSNRLSLHHFILSGSQVNNSSVSSRFLIFNDWSISSLGEVLDTDQQCDLQAILLREHLSKTKIGRTLSSGFHKVHAVVISFHSPLMA